MAAVRFVEVMRRGGDGDQFAVVASDEPSEPEDLEIDEDFLRRVREA
jgi:hypothetical protein